MLQTHSVRKAVFPVRGLGTRFLPTTKASPKEMLTVVDKPLIQYAVEEAYAAGIRQMIFVTGRTKRSIEDHFDKDFELENQLAADGKHELLDLVQRTAPSDMSCLYIRQHQALGLGHAILCARDLVQSEPFAVVLPDDLMVDETPLLAQMIEQFNQQQASIIAVEEVSLKETKNYGIIAGHEISPNLIKLTGIVEKPAPDQAPSRLAVAGRYILTPAIFDEIDINNKGFGGEIQLTDAIARLVHKESVLAYRYSGHHYDCGKKLGYLQATVRMAMAHDRLGKEFNSWLQTLLEKG